MMMTKKEIAIDFVIHWIQIPVVLLVLVGFHNFIAPMFDGYTYLDVVFLVFLICIYGRIIKL